MKRFHGVVLVGVILVLAISLSASGAMAGSKEDMEAINKVREAEAALVNTGNPDGVADVYAENIEHMAPDEPMTTGRDGAKQTLTAMIGMFDINLEYTDSDIKILGDWAIERYAAKAVMTPKEGGDSMTQHVKGIHVYHRGEDGTWRITHDVWNHDAPTH
jgi:uncharacterized protein (TIGR02246 family)